MDLELRSLFEGELNPVAPKAQKKVPVPEGLDLDEWINEPPSDLEEDTNEPSSTDAHVSLKGHDDRHSTQAKFTLSLSSVGHASYSGDLQGGHSATSTGNVGAKAIQPELSQEELSKMRETRKIQTDANPFYIKEVKVRAELFYGLKEV